MHTYQVKQLGDGGGLSENNVHRGGAIHVPGRRSGALVRGQGRALGDHEELDPDLVPDQVVGLAGIGQAPLLAVDDEVGFGRHSAVGDVDAGGEGDAVRAVADREDAADAV